ncbi:tyrosine-type recombinase/integrase [Rhodococcus sp. BP-252]|nr:tyrosine-type recombinase/integrase [Rhodococcus sp. BP-320]MBY6417305.1 tyrosine-type recombinase/integrase [Rhodococcus sp. BP-321]MBY6421910.1 tyrosine-type recombinase/integrase [Rhodococcus sp. BP-324]MBY6427329.1 tyrosine-type recombinase/integrase [Rhodococcus sp. BP-323]MBY6432528.1 tyrosine-type recombinase/integrase [Rhodococcus sp. BP-322]MBY6441338.1 tyrosine-type recombinase/integrase [Rhodococcus sp. BP-319]MBY6445267.1 tyrosine-type recombinase/integrase [Rhodococcus sp. BP-
MTFGRSWRWPRSRDYSRRGRCAPDPRRRLPTPRDPHPPPDAASKRRRGRDPRTEVRQRTRHTRAVRVARIVVEHIRLWRPQADPSNWLFPGENGHPWHQNSVSYRWRKTKATAGQSDWHLHDLRHFFASGLIYAGCDVVTVQKARSRLAERHVVDLRTLVAERQRPHTQGGRGVVPRSRRLTHAD